MSHNIIFKRRGMKIFQYSKCVLPRSDKAFAFITGSIISKTMKLDRQIFKNCKLK